MGLSDLFYLEIEALDFDLEADFLSYFLVDSVLFFLTLYYLTYYFSSSIYYSYSIAFSYFLGEASFRDLGLDTLPVDFLAEAYFLVDTGF